ncbi:phasin family protein [Cupriavidus basilensis]|uniref:phasin family protein n=1 Tax=Cupriavidus basilensis TaxID=68895 RepID=UPI0023E8E44E|nr:phasin family protein [Cupriavidus basilensis]MDF3888519.1 phasin family protein [Cupriavidus basilensis]
MSIFAPDQFAVAQKANLANVFALTNTAFEAFQRLAELNLQATKSTLAESQDRIQALLAGKDLREVLAVQSGVAQPAADKAISYARHLLEIASSTQAEFAKLVEAQYEQHNSSVQAFVEHLVKNAPVGSEAATAVLQAAVAATNGTYSAVQKVAQQTAEAAKINIDAVTAVSSGAVRRAAA